MTLFKTILSILLISPLATFGQTDDQRPFRDALDILQSVKDKGDNHMAILGKYPDHASNNFLKSSELYRSIGAGVAADAYNESRNADVSYSFIPQAEALDALGSFIAERFKQELNIAFLDNFKKELKKQPDLQTLLPVTYEYLLNNEPYNYSAFLKSLRSALQQDLHDLPANIASLYEKKENVLVPGTLSNDEFIATLLGLQAIKSYLDDESSAQLILSVTRHQKVAAIVNKEMKLALTMTGVVTSELMDSVRGDWYSDGELKKVFGDKDGRLLFIGLFQEKYGNHPDIGSLVDDSRIANYLDEYYRFNQMLGSYRNQIQLIVGSGGKPDSKQLLQYAALSLRILEKATDLRQFGMAPPDSTLVKVLSIANESLAVLENVLAREYAGSFVKSLALINQILPQSEFKDEFVRYGNFAVNIATAKNSEEMVNALETAALPVGSYKIKRNSLSNISLNSYAGAFIGQEWNSLRGGGTLPAGTNSKSAIAGFTAPIGVAFSWGTRETYKADNNAQEGLRKFDGRKHTTKVLKGSSWSMMISVLDVGAITAFRLKNDNTSALPDVRFANFLAPGGYVVRNMKNVPLSWSLGAQYGPQVRTIKNLTDQEDLLAAWSVRLSLVVDIPIFNFYTKMEK